ncbi:ABC transporter permease [Paenibacillus yanchengensis]|uniref:ABC transporter permease n=1 Tax=Paenibacillus yanchengensis TaxID=2035833 RepID=A0ABW4YNF6_9BACL
MILLIKNELMKLHASKKIALVLSILIALPLALLVLIKSWMPLRERYESYLEYVLLNLNTVYFLLTIAGILLASKIISDEIQQGTIKQLLLRPHSRPKILLSKYVAILLILFSGYFLVVIISIALGLPLFGADDAARSIGDVMQLVLFKGIATIFYTTLAFMLSIVWKSSVLPLTSSIILFLLNSFVTKLIAMVFKKYAGFVVLTQLDLQIYSTVNMGYPYFSMLTAALYVVFHIVLFLIITSITFNKQDML